VKLLIDMNLSPDWVEFFASRAIEANHWSTLGDPRAPDEEIMMFARDHGFVVFTHDLDFGDLLASTNANGPSVIQVRTQDPTPDVVGDVVMAACHDLREQLDRGALVTLELARQRSRVLPLFPRRSES
jgi:predicted nuclease of predicted toxin-antitoxin system